MKYIYYGPHSPALLPFFLTMYTATTFPVCCPFLHPDRIQRIHQWRLRVAKSRRHSSSKHCHHQQPASSSSSTSASEGTPPPRRGHRTSRRRRTEGDEGYGCEGYDEGKAVHDSASSYSSSWSSEDDDNDDGGDDDGDDDDDDDQLHHPIIDLLPDPERNPLVR